MMAMSGDQKPWDWPFLGLGKPNPKAPLALLMVDTILLEGGAAKCRLSTARDGSIVVVDTKDKIDIVDFLETAAEAALSSLKNQRHTVAVLRIPTDNHTTVQALDEAACRELVRNQTSYLQEAIALQAFVNSKDTDTLYRTEYLLKPDGTASYKTFLRMKVDAKDGTHTTKFVLCKDPQLTSALNERTATVVNHLEAVYECVLKRMYCDYICDDRDVIWFAQAVNIFTTTARAAHAAASAPIDKTPEVPVPAATTPLLKPSDAKHATPNHELDIGIPCMGDYCDNNLEHTATGELHLVPHTGPTPSGRWQMINKSIVLARFEMMMRDPNAASKSATFRRIRPEDYYSEVPVCHNCHNIYAALDKRRNSRVSDTFKRQNSDQAVDRAKKSPATRMRLAAPDRANSLPIDAMRSRSPSPTKRSADSPKPSPVSAEQQATIARLTARKPPLKSPSPAPESPPMRRSKGSPYAVSMNELMKPKKRRTPDRRTGALPPLDDGSIMSGGRKETVPRSSPNTSFNSVPRKAPRSAETSPEPRPIPKKKSRSAPSSARQRQSLSPIPNAPLPAKTSGRTVAQTPSLTPSPESNTRDLSSQLTSPGSASSAGNRTARKGAARRGELESLQEHSELTDDDLLESARRHDRGEDVDDENSLGGDAEDAKLEAMISALKQDLAGEGAPVPDGRESKTTTENTKDEPDWSDSWDEHSDFEDIDHPVKPKTPARANPSPYRGGSLGIGESDSPQNHAPLPPPESYPTPKRTTTSDSLGGSLGVRTNSGELKHRKTVSFSSDEGTPEAAPAIVIDPASRPTASVTSSDGVRGAKMHAEAIANRHATPVQARVDEEDDPFATDDEDEFDATAASTPNLEQQRERTAVPLGDGTRRTVTAPLPARPPSAPLRETVSTPAPPKPATPSTSAKPGTPSATTKPGTPGTAAKPGTPGASKPGTPSATAKPATPSATAKPSTPVRAASPVKPPPAVVLPATPTQKHPTPLNETDPFASDDDDPPASNAQSYTARTLPKTPLSPPLQAVPLAASHPIGHPAPNAGTSSSTSTRGLGAHITGEDNLSVSHTTMASETSTDEMSGTVAVRPQEAHATAHPPAINEETDPFASSDDEFDAPAPVKATAPPPDRNQTATPASDDGSEFSF